MDNLINKFPNEDLFIICSERKKDLYQPNINPKYKDYKNVLIFQYEELLATEEWPLTSIFDNFLNKLYDFMPKKYLKDERKNYLEKITKRITEMNLFYEKIKDRSFDYYQNKYLLHGQHRNRKW